MDDDAWARLGQAVTDRRHELGLSVRAAATTADINRATWGTLESGERRLSSHLWASVESALAWAPGSIEAILAGGVPTPRRDAATTHPAQVPALPHDFDLNAEIDKVMRLDLPAQNKLKLARQITELYEQAQAERRAAQR